MAHFEKHLFVKKSTLPNAGKGLYTKVAIPKGTLVVEYKGKITTWKDVKDDDGKNAYIFYVKRYHVIDAWKTMKPLARYANDARGLTRIKGITNNCDYIIKGLKAFIETKKAIPAGAEIFVDYGPDYWKVIRENIETDAEAKKKEEKAKKKQKTKKKQKKVKHKTPKRVDTHLKH